MTTPEQNAAAWAERFAAYSSQTVAWCSSARPTAHSQTSLGNLGSSDGNLRFSTGDGAYPVVTLGSKQYVVAGRRLKPARPHIGRLIIFVLVLTRSRGQSGVGSELDVVRADSHERQRMSDGLGLAGSGISHRDQALLRELAPLAADVAERNRTFGRIMGLASLLTVAARPLPLGGGCARCTSNFMEDGRCVGSSARCVTARGHPFI